MERFFAVTVIVVIVDLVFQCRMVFVRDFESNFVRLRN